MLEVSNHMQEALLCIPGWKIKNENEMRLCQQVREVKALARQA